MPASDFINDQQDLARIFEWAERNERTNDLAEKYMNACVVVFDTEESPDKIAYSALRVRDHFGRLILRHLRTQ